MRSVLGLLCIAALAFSSPAIRVDVQMDAQKAIILSGQANVKDAVMCAACKDIVDDVENHEEATIEARVDASIQSHCNNLGFLAGACKKIMTDVEDKVVEGINNNYSPDQICQMADIC